MRKFAHWTNTPANPGLADVEQFIVDIPEGVDREDVIAKLSLEIGAHIDESDGLEFQEKWPHEIQRQFDEISGMILRWNGR